MFVHSQKADQGDIYNQLRGAMCTCKALVFLDKYAGAQTHAQAAVKLGRLIETATGDNGERVYPDLPRVTVAYNAYQLALCLAELDFETNKSKI